LLILALILACSRGPEPDGELTLPQAADKVHFGVIADLGPHSMQARIQTTTGGQGREAEVRADAVDLKWRDEGAWYLRIRRDERLATEVLVADGIAWVGEGGRPMARKGPADAWNKQLTQTWDPWQLAFESLASRIGVEEPVADEVEGRRAWRYRVLLLPPTAAKRVWDVSKAEGQVWLDELTAVRMLADVHVLATSGTRTREVDLKFAIAGLGVPPTMPEAPG
jgi:hypothetical protein